MDKSSDATQSENQFLGKIKGDTTLFSISIDTLLFPDDSTCVVLYKYIPSRSDPCSHAEGSQFQLGYFKLMQNTYSFLKLSELLSTWGPWCDTPELTFLQYGKQNIILFIANDGHQGAFRNYVTVVSANLKSLGKCYINFESPTENEMIEFLPFEKNKSDDSNLERTTHYDGTFAIDTTEFKQGLLRFVNRFYIIKSYGWPENEMGDTIIKDRDLREYLFVADNFVLKKQIIKTPEWVK